MASRSLSKKPVQQVESETATVRFTGGTVSGSDSDSETPSESEANDESPNVRKVETQAAIQPFVPDNQEQARTEQEARCVNNTTDNPNDISSGENSVMVSSSDSGCPCSPFEESADVMAHDDNQAVETDNQARPSAEVELNDKPKPPTHLDINGDQSSIKSGGANEAPQVTSPTRFNPFNKADTEEQLDPFPQLGRPPRHDRFDSFNSDFDLDLSQDNSVEVSDFRIKEDYFSQPEGDFGAMTMTEIQSAIDTCRQKVLEASEEGEAKKNLVHRLVQLRLRLTEAQEEQVTPDPKVRQVVGHSFSLKDNQRSRRYCEQCNTVIWGVLQNWYRCDSCGYCCHEKCLDHVTRSCASLKVKESTELNLNICPEKSLSTQGYKCAECRTPISYHSTEGEPRLCDYTGNFYCDRCHWNDLMVIPARVLHNWDFEPRKVCRGTKQFLRLMKNKAVLRVQDINPMLFNFVEEVNDVKKLREEILIMKKYFLSCKDALQSKLLLQLQDRQHFVENSDMFSLKDLQDIADDVLLPELAKIHASFAQHIKTDCELCKAKGYHCELCTDQEVLFPFDNIAIVCSQCSTVLHRHCFMRRNQKCPKCMRICSRMD